jgi:hypothetical protein
MVYYGHEGVWGGRGIIDGYRRFYGMVTIENGSVQTTENMLIK